MKIINTKTGDIYDVVDYMPNPGQIGKALAKILLTQNHRDDGGKWAEVEEIESTEEKPKRKRASRKKKE